jgi:hypothetical protein
MDGNLRRMAVHPDKTSVHPAFILGTDLFLPKFGIKILRWVEDVLAPKRPKKDARTMVISKN